MQIRIIKKWNLGRQLFSFLDIITSIIYFYILYIFVCYTQSVYFAPSNSPLMLKKPQSNDNRIKMNPFPIRAHYRCVSYLKS